MMTLYEARMMIIEKAKHNGLTHSEQVTRMMTDRQRMLTTLQLTTDEVSAIHHALDHLQAIDDEILTADGGILNPDVTPTSIKLERATIGSQFTHVATSTTFQLCSMPVVKVDVPGGCVYKSRWHLTSVLGTQPDISIMRDDFVGLIDAGTWRIDRITPGFGHK